MIVACERKLKQNAFKPMPLIECLATAMRIFQRNVTTAQTYNADKSFELTPQPLMYWMDSKRILTRSITKLRLNYRIVSFSL